MQQRWQNIMMVSILLLLASSLQISAVSPGEISSDSVTVEWVKDQMEDCLMETAAQGNREYYLNRNKTAEDFIKLKCKVFGINKTSSTFDMQFFQENDVEFNPYYINNVGHFVMMDDPDSFNIVLDSIITSL